MAAPSLTRIIKYLALALIGLSVIAQLAALAVMRNGAILADNPFLMAVLGATSFATLPGIIAAFMLFVRNAIASAKEPAARPKAVIFLLIALLPFALPHSLPDPMRSMPQAANTDTDSVQESEQFLAGRDWAAINKPLRGSQCPGSDEFIRGCRSNIDARQKENIAIGRAWASAHQPAKAALCRGPVPYVVLGCRQYFFEYLAKPKPAGQGKYEGMTSAECADEVNANFEASEQLDLENGNPESAAVTRRRHWEPELKDCENYDKLVENTFMPKAYDRLQKVLDQLKAGGAVSEAQHAELRRDFTTMASVRDQPYKSAYLSMFEQYTALMSHP